MTNNVVHILFNENQKLPADQVLEETKDKLNECFVIGSTHDDELYVAGTGNVRDAIYFLERAIIWLLKIRD